MKQRKRLTNQVQDMYFSYVHGKYQTDAATVSPIQGTFPRLSLLKQRLAHWLCDTIIQAYVASGGVSPTGFLCPVL